MTKLLVPDQRLDVMRDAVVVHDDFTHYVSADEFTTVATDSGTVAVSDAKGGIVTLTPSDGTVANNDETYMKGTKEVFLFAANKPLVFEALVQFTEGNTDDANILAGLMNAVAANSLVDDGGGPQSSFSGLVFYKVDGGTKWIVASSVGTTRNTNTTNVTAGGSAYQKLRAEFLPYSTTNAHAVFFIDDVQCVDNTTGLPIKHDFVFTSATEMQLAFGIKNGADTTSEALLVDYVHARQKR